MNQNDPTITFHRPGLGQKIDLYLVGLGLGFNSGVEKRRRLHEAYALDSLSDCQLALMGLSRADIPAFVFADLCGGP